MRHNFETMKHYTESRDGFHQDVQNVIIIDNMKKDTVGTLQLVFFLFSNSKWTTDQHQYRRQFEDKVLTEIKFATNNTLLL